VQATTSARTPRGHQIGTKIILTRDLSGDGSNEDLWVTNANGSNPTRLTNDVSTQESEAWYSPFIKCRPDYADSVVTDRRLWSSDPGVVDRDLQADAGAAAFAGCGERLAAVGAGHVVDDRQAEP
jgi:hypothetical protein